MTIHHFGLLFNVEKGQPSGAISFRGPWGSLSLSRNLKGDIKCELLPPQPSKRNGKGTPR